MEQELDILINYLRQIKEVDSAAMVESKIRLDSLSKPIEGLGRLERICMRLSGITGQVYNELPRKTIVLMCADNGVEEEVSIEPYNMTLAKVVGFTKGLTAGSVIAKANNVDLKIIDVGINSEIELPNLKNCKINKGTNNIRKGPAMSYDECVSAMVVGIETIRDLKDNYDIVGIGEIGDEMLITARALIVALTRIKIEELLPQEDLFHQREIILEALRVNMPSINETIETVAKIGGFDIAAMIGMCIGAAVFQIPIVVDGIISMVAALAAYRINPAIKDYIILSNEVNDEGYRIIAEELGLYPILNLDMKLGEGCGCSLAFSIIDSACATIRDMGTTEEISLDKDYIESKKN